MELPKEFRCIIYCIYNLLNNKIYIGSSNNYIRRKKRHIIDLNSGNHHSILLQRSWIKYKKESFSFFIIQNIKYINKIEQYEIEQYYINLLKPEYNLNNIANGGCSFRTKETKEKISKALIGKKLSKETKDNISKAHLGKKHSQIHIERMIKSKTGVRNKLKWISIIQYNEEFSKIFSSITDAAKFTNIQRTNIMKCLKGTRKTAGNFKWKYKTNE